MDSGRPGAGAHTPRRAGAVLAALLLAAAATTGCARAASTVSFAPAGASGPAADRPRGEPLASAPAVVVSGPGERPGGPNEDRRGGSTDSEPPEALEVRFSPAPGTVDVPLDAAVEVEVSGGELLGLTVTTPEGPAAGSVQDGRFKPQHGLRFSTEYVLAATVRAADGERSVHRAAFATMAPAEEVEAFVYPNDGDVVGVGMPVIVSFSDEIPVQDRLAVTARLAVHAEPAVQGAWRWVSDSEVHWRPLQYWPARTQVWVAADLGGLSAGGRWFTASALQHFAIGEHHRFTVDAVTHQMVAYENGIPIRSMPISAGKESYPTASGIDLIMEKHDVFEMDSTSVGIYGAEAYNVVVDDALRLTNSGTFIHAAPWNGSLGAANLSHGCINASNEDAQWMMDYAYIGDPVEIFGTPEQVSPGNGWGDWNVSATDWLAPQ
jgi:lipoprotein-anchoring transpeptidase ErfK/SrfK